MPKTHKYVYSFGNKKADGNGSMKPLLGGKVGPETGTACHARERVHPFILKRSG